MNNLDLATKLNRRIDLVKISEVMNERGRIETKEEKIATVWASIKTISGSEWFNFKRRDSSAYHEVTIRFLPELNVGHFAIIKEKRMRIKSVEHDEEARKTTTFVAEEVNEPVKPSTL